MFPNLGPMEMVVVMIVAVLLFGKRLPEVGRSLGKGIVEFKKGLRGIEDEFDVGATKSFHSEPAPPREAVAPSVPKFEPPSAPPTAATTGPETTNAAVANNAAVAVEAQPYQD